MWAKLGLFDPAHFMVLCYVKKKGNSIQITREQITNAPKPFGEQTKARVHTKEESKLILHARNQG
jgi:hypothetical protein